MNFNSRSAYELLTLAFFWKQFSLRIENARIPGLNSNKITGQVLLALSRQLDLDQQMQVLKTVGLGRIYLLQTVSGHYFLALQAVKTSNFTPAAGEFIFVNTNRRNHSNFTKQQHLQHITNSRLEEHLILICVKLILMVIFTITDHLCFNNDRLGQLVFLH